MDDNHPDKLQLLKDTICKGITNDEAALFHYSCKKWGLDPFARQIYPVKRWNSSLKRESMTIQTGIDGYRLIADRTGKYAPGKKPEFIYDKEGCLVCADSFVKKQTQDGTWHEVCASAYYSEYVVRLKDGKPNSMWATRERTMLAKCAETLALRKAFPAELSGLLTDEEMGQADNPTVNFKKPQPKKMCTPDQFEAFLEVWSLTYEREELETYIDKKSSHFKEDKKQTVYFLMNNQKAFEEEFLRWKKQNGKTFAEDQKSDKSIIA